MVVTVAAFSVFLAVATSVSHSTVTTVLGRQIMTVASGSMSPVFRTGDLIVDRPIAAAEASRLHVGQVITFRVGSGLTNTHRIIEVVPGPGGVAYRTKGDANNAPDTTLRPAASVIGTYSFRVPYAGYFLASLHRPSILAALLVAPVLLVLGLHLLRRAREEPGGDADSGVPDGDGRELATVSP